MPTAKTKRTPRSIPRTDRPIVRPLTSGFLGFAKYNVRRTNRLCGSTSRSALLERADVSDFRTELLRSQLRGPGPAPEVGVFHAGVFGQLGGGAFQDERAELEHVETVGERDGKVSELLDQQQCGPL